MLRILTLLSSTLITASSLLYLASCHSEKYGSSKPLIVGGSSVQTKSPAAKSLVALVSTHADRLTAFCSGILIAPQLVLTAAHCLEGIEKPSQIQVFFGSHIDGTDAPKRQVTAMRSFQAEPARYYPNFDVAWLQLAEPAPSPYQAIEILRDPAQLAAHLNGEKPTLLAGFGKTATSCSRPNSFCSGEAREVSTRLRRYINSAHFRQLLITGPSPGQGTCNGDSGGPAYVEIGGKWFLLGLLHGKNFLLNSKAMLNPKQICESGESTYTFAGAYLNWVEASAAVTLPFDASLNPATAAPQEGSAAGEDDAEDSMSTLEEYLAYAKPDSELWKTAAVLFAGFKDADKQGLSELDAIVTDPHRAAIAMQKWEKFKASGIGYNLNTLAVRVQQISDLRPLAFLKQLKHLELSDHRIYDTSPLAKLEHLEELKLSNNYDFQSKTKIPWDLRFLKHLPRLRVLNLLTNGESLDLKQVPWTHLKSLESLILSNNAGSLDLWAVPWSQLPQLKKLVIVNSELNDITPLAGARKLEQLNLRRNKISDISMLESLKNLRVLDVSQNQIEDFGPIVNLDSLERLLALGNPTETAPCPVGASCIYTPQQF